MRLLCKGISFDSETFLPEVITATTKNETPYTFYREKDWSNEKEFFYQCKEYPQPHLLFSENADSLILKQISLRTGIIDTQIVNQGLGYNIIKIAAKYARSHNKPLILERTNNYFTIQTAHKLDPQSIYYVANVTTELSKQYFFETFYESLLSLLSFQPLEIDAAIEPEDLVLSGYFSDLFPAPRSLNKDNFEISSDVNDRVTLTELNAHGNFIRSINGLIFPELTMHIVCFGDPRKSYFE
jgi:hypothetical protein